MEFDDKSVPNTSDNEDPISVIKERLKFLKYDHSIERVRTTHFVFPEDVDDFKLELLSDLGREIVRNYLHVGIVSDACEKPYKQYEVLLVHWPSNIPRSVYEDKSRTHLMNVKKVRTIIFAIPQNKMDKISKSLSDLSIEDIIASTAILAEPDVWTLLQSKVMSSFFHIFNSQSADDPLLSGYLWKQYPIGRLEDQWKQMLFLCCVNYDVGYHLKQMTKRNWARIQKLCAFEIKQASTVLERLFIPSGLFLTCVIWCQSPGIFTSIVKLLAEVNTTESCLDPSDILNTIETALVAYLNGLKKFVCSMCGYTVDHSFHFENHLRAHSGEKPYKCQTCGKQFSQQGTLYKHNLVHKGSNRYYCQFCGRTASQSSALKYHVQCIHLDKGDISHRCFSCQAIFPDELTLKDHVAVHVNDLTFECDICLLRFPSSDVLLRHEAVHSLDKPYKCHKCERSFLTEFAVNRHMSTVHSDLRNFHCTFCGKGFKAFYDQRKHEVLKHNEARMLKMENEKEER